MDELVAVRQYLPRVLLSASPPARGWWQCEGTLLFSDVSGFTALSERLARHGKVGAEEMVNAISTVFTPLLTEIDAHGGDVLKFGGDALLTFFVGPDHVVRAAACAHRLRQVLRHQGRVRTAYGTVPLGMSQGLHSGDVHFFVCGSDYSDIVIAGPAVTETLAMESAAERGEVLLSPHAAAAVPARLLRGGHDGGALLVAPPRADALTPATPTVADPRAHVHVPLALRGRLADIVGDSEHRQITVAFLQFAGCDEILADQGPDELQRRLHEVTDAVAGAADEHGVTVICIDVGGDGGKYMLACGAPDAQERDAEMMLRFGTALLSRDLPLRLRLGVNRGNTFAGRVGGPDRWTYSTMGDPVNLAARVMGKAPYGCILATSAVIDRVAALAEIETVGPFMVKGKARPVEAAIVRGMSHPTARRNIELDTTPFIGREEHVQTIVDAWADVRHGRGRVVEIVAEAGAGKSRLVTEALSRLQPGRTVQIGGERYHRGSAYFAAHLLIRRLTEISIDADPDDAGHALTRWLDDHAPQLREWAPLIAVAARARVPSTATVDTIAPEFRSTRMHEVVAQLLRVATTEPIAVILEDAFWYDDASVQLLVDVLQDLSGLRWLVCLTRRDETTGLHCGLGFDADRITLTALTPEQAAVLAKAVAADTLSADEARQLADAGNGNPFFVLQMAHAWSPSAAALPGDVESVVSARLGRLPVASRRLLGRAAVLGSYVDLPLLTTVLGETVDESAMKPLIGDYLVVDTPGRLRFVHDLYRTVAYDSLPFRRRRELHARAGDALEHLGEHGARAPLLSVHFEAAGDHPKTWQYAVLGGDRARSNYANGEAATLYERAIAASRHLRELPDEEVVRVHEALGDVNELLGHYDQAAQSYLTARRRCHGRQTSVRLLRKLGIVRERQSRYREALRWYTRAIHATDDLPSRDAHAARAALLVGTAATRYRQGRFALAAESARSAAAEAGAADALGELAHAYYLLDAALTDLHDPAALDYRQLALPIYREIGDLVGEADVHNNIGIDAYYEGRLDDALASYRRSLECRRRAGDVVGAATSENNIGEVLSDLGRLDEAAAMFEEAIAVCRRANYPVVLAQASSNLARVHVRQGHPDVAAALMDDAERRFTEMGSDALLLETRVRRAELLLSCGDADAARKLAEDLQRQAAQAPPSPVVSAALDHVLGAALIRTGEREAGVEAVRRAIATFEANGMEWDAAAARAEIEVRIPQQRTVTLPDAEPILSSRQQLRR